LGRIEGGLAAHDLKTIPGGIEQMAKVEAREIANTARHPWVTGKQKEALLNEYKHPLRAPSSDSPDYEALNLVRGQAEGVKASFQHPGRDPFQTLLNATAVLHGGAAASARAAEVARTGKLGAALRPFEPAPRLLHVGDTEVGLHPSRTPLNRAAQKLEREPKASLRRLNDFARRSITRGIWFYPWVKGASVFAGHTFSEHPYKSAILGNAGVQGRETQEAELGDLPSYEQGLMRLAGSGDHPLVADFSTFSPFATPADVLEIAAHRGELPGFLNPVYGAAADAALRQNQFGSPTTQPPNAIPSTLTSPTPEFQILSAYLPRHKDQSNRMFHTTPMSAFLRSLIGPGTPRHVTEAAHKAAGREKSGRYGSHLAQK